MRKKPSKDDDGDIDFGPIDQYSLDSEWVRHDRLVGYYGPKSALAKRKLEECKTACKIFEAETARRIRRKPVRYGVKRLTEAAVKEVVLVELLTSNEHDLMIEAQYEVDLYAEAMRRLEHRKRLLSDLIYLHGQSYFSVPSMPKSTKMRNKIQRKREGELRGLKDE